MDLYYRNPAWLAGQSDPCSSLAERHHGGGCVADRRTTEAFYSPNYDTWPLAASFLTTMHCLSINGTSAIELCNNRLWDDQLENDVALHCPAMIDCSSPRVEAFVVCGCPPFFDCF